MIAIRPVSASHNAKPVADAKAALSARGALDRLSWDNLRLFLAVVEAGSFRSAASLAGVSINTIRTKVELLERQLGGPLLRRSVEGVVATQDGRELVEIAREMRTLGRTTARVARGPGADRDQVRLVTTEGVGAVWLMPQIASRQPGEPDVRLSMSCERHDATVLFRDIDLSVQCHEPTDPDLVIEHLGTLHILPFAADAYLAAHGKPMSLADAEGHKLVWLETDLIGTEQADALMAPADRKKMTTLETNSTFAHYWAVANGTGIGFLPSYVCALDPDLRVLDLGVRLERDIVLAYRAAALDDPNVALVRSWIHAAFDNVAHPWFAKDFVHPEALPGAANPVRALRRPAR